MDSMDLFKTWQMATADQITYIKSSKEEIMEAIKSTSSSTIGQIKNRMKMKLGWIVLFVSLTLIWMILDHSNTELLYIQSFLVAMFGIGMISLYPLYQKMNNAITTGADALSVMKLNSNLIRKALRRETIWGLVFIPVSTIIGFGIGEIYTGGSIMDLMMDPKALIILLVVSAVLVPLANIGAYKTNQKAFGEFIAELDQNIIKMETL